MLYNATRYGLFFFRNRIFTENQLIFNYKIHEEIQGAIDFPFHKMLLSRHKK